MEAKKEAQALSRRMEDNLKECILPFWRTYLVDEENGGFYGRVRADRTPVPKSPKSVVLNCRLLWTFTRAYEAFRDERDRQLARRAYSYIRRYFWDESYGGAYWMVTEKGEPSEPEKRTYGQAFLIYSMAEYYRVFRDEEAKRLAEQTLKLVNRHLKWESGGYRDSAARDWQKDPWVEVWVKNPAGAAKLLNSNMHLFEAILGLAEAIESAEVRDCLREELEFLLDTAMDWPCGHLKAGMAEDGTRLDGEINYGHDSECSYLMTKAARLLGDEVLIRRSEEAAVTLMEHVCQEGLDPVEGGMYYRSDQNTGETNRAKIWWVQAEGITACFHCWQITGDETYLKAARDIWNYTEEQIVNPTAGDWDSVGGTSVPDEAYQRDVKALRAVFSNEEKAGKGKCPYHNSRACFEIMECVKQLGLQE